MKKWGKTVLHSGHSPMANCVFDSLVVLHWEIHRSFCKNKHICEPPLNFAVKHSVLTLVPNTSLRCSGRLWSAQCLCHQGMRPWVSWRAASCSLCPRMKIRTQHEQFVLCLYLKGAVSGSWGRWGRWIFLG